MTDQQKIDQAALQSEKDLIYWQKLQAFLQEQEAGLTDEDRRIREECEGSLYTFVKYAWKYMDPSEFIDGWHLEAVCEHLQSQKEGEIRHLLINQPPRTAKSLIGSVSLTPWVWTQSKTTTLSGPDMTFLYASYAQTLSFRDSLKARRLITSPWYQKLWGTRFQLSDDMNTKGRFTNNMGGHRIATSVGGQLTGDGASWIFLDDVHNSVEVESNLVRQGVIDWWTQSLSTRHNRPKTDVFTIVMQRLNQLDLSGYILELGDQNFTHLCLPMRYEQARHCITSIGFSDPRTEEGELLWPERLGEKEVKSLEKSLGRYGSAGQLQQAPAPKGGGIIADDLWVPWTETFFPPMDFIVASCDTAYTEQTENDYSACVVLGVYSDVRDFGLPKVMVMHAWQERLGLNALVRKINSTAKKYKVDRVLIENKASGISVSQELRRLFGNELFGLSMINPKGDKFARLMAVEHLFCAQIIHGPFIKEAESGNIIPRDWLDTLIGNVSIFPKGAHDDQVDAISMGLKYLRDNGLIIKKDEADAVSQSGMLFLGKKEALYDI